MRPRLIAIVTALLAVGAGMLVTAAPASASAYAIDSPSLSPSTTTVTGLTGTALATVSVHVTSTPAVDICGGEANLIGSGHVNATLLRTSGGTADYVDVVLNLASGTSSDGMWSGTWRIGAGRGGTWQIARIWWCNGQDAMSGDDGHTVDPRLAPTSYTGTLTVTATAAPRVTVTRIPRIAAYGASQSVRLNYASSTGAPLAGHLVTLGDDTACGFYSTGSRLAKLDSHGSIGWRFGSLSPCIFLTQPVTATITSSTTIITQNYPGSRSYYRTVTGRAVSPTFTVGTDARVKTLVYPGTGVATLQVLTGRTWHSITSKTLSGSLLNLYVRAGVRASWVTGPHYYRVLAQLAKSQGDWLAPTTSSTFTMTGL